MTLRRRLVLIVLVLLTLGFVTAGASTVAALLDWKTTTDDRLMTQVGREAAAIVSARAGRGQGLTLPPESGDLRRLWRAGAGHGGFPSFLQIRGPDGAAVQTLAFAETPPVPAAVRAGRPSEGNPDGERFSRIETRVAGDGDRSEGPFGGQAPDWRVRAALLPDGQGTLVMAMRTTEQDELLGRTLGTLVTVTVAVLGGVGLLAWWAIRSALRPLDEIAETAAAIGGGDLARRVDVPGPRTEVGRLSTALNGMLAQIEAAFREREASENRLRRFIADASHELRTPVATMRGYAELFRRGAADRPGDLAKAMRRIESEAERMGLLVDEMLLLARLDQGRPLERRPVDLAVLAADAVADAGAVEPGRPLTLDAAEPVIVSGDAERLRQVLANLLANVRRHTPAGTPAAVRAALDGDRAVIEVADQGPGLTEEQRAKVFERFYRADAARSRDHGGAGLGLSIVAAVAQAHGGTATVRSAPGEGAVFTVTLPTAPT
ncbi:MULTISPECIES: sensor histidine kinase [Actinomadura]|uniref:histidine kinase n=2 Tax=Actinomadura yumaensis TaxID=111807 RepID=A0ABW2CFC4_9ACTN|nr:HAMP domain-containing sensor histidine kinase [Actinomadura sp. J1-007]